MAWPKGKPRKQKIAPQVETRPTLTYEFDRNKDFTGWRLKDLPHWAPKAARCGAATSDVVIGKHECVNCKLFCWYTDAREDLCESCEYLLKDKLRDNQKQKVQRNANRIINPFASVGGVARGFWPR